jgi:hypothetical protein
MRFLTQLDAIVTEKDSDVSPQKLESVEEVKECLNKQEIWRQVDIQ